MRLLFGVAAIALAFPLNAAAQGLQLRVVSNPRPEFVSGGDVLVNLALPAGTQASAVRLTLNGSDITSALRSDTTGRTMMALVKGLNDGSNALVASAGKATAKLTVVNHPVAGPVISRTHETPFICETEKVSRVSGSGAGEARAARRTVGTRRGFVNKPTRPRRTRRSRPWKRQRLQ